MHLVEFVDYEVIPTEECFLIKPLRDLYNKDKSKNKEKFMQQISFIYHYVDPRSSYNYIVDDNERMNLIIEQEGLKNFKIDDDIQMAIQSYKERVITTSYLLLQDTRMAVDKVRQFLKDINLNDTDNNGKPIYTINTVVTALKQIPDLAKQLIETEKILTKEIEEQGRARGGNESKKAFEDGV